MYGLLATFLILTGAGIAAAGLAGYLIFAPLAWRHLKDRSHNKSPYRTFISPGFFIWILSGRWRQLCDPGLTGLAAPARWLGIAFVLGSLLAGVAWWIGRTI